MGCGSGILSIAALLLGAEKAVGVDIDPLAVKTARENGELNGFTPPVLTILHGDLVDKVEGRYDVVAANIVADAIIDVSKRQAPGRGINPPPGRRCRRSYAHGDPAARRTDRSHREPPPAAVGRRPPAAADCGTLWPG